MIISVLQSNCYGATPASLLLDKNIPDGAKTIFALLALRGFVTDGLINTPMSILADDFCIPYETLRKHVAKLSKAGYLEHNASVCDEKDSTLLTMPIEKEKRTVRNWWRNEAETLTTKSVDKNRSNLTGIKDEKPVKSYRFVKEKTGQNPPVPKSHPLKRFNTLKTRSVCKKESPKKDGWKSDAEEIKKAAVLRAAAARAKKKPKKKVQSIARPAELESVPVSRWGSRHLAAYFLRRYCEAYPREARLPPGSILTDRQKKHLKDLVAYFTNPVWSEEDSYSWAIQATKKYIDFVFDNRERLVIGLKIHGSLLPGVLLGFRSPLVADMNGETVIGRGLVATETSKTDIGGYGEDTVRDDW